MFVHPRNTAEIDSILKTILPVGRRGMKLCVLVCSGLSLQGRDNVTL